MKNFSLFYHRIAFFFLGIFQAMHFAWLSQSCVVFARDYGYDLHYIFWLSSLSLSYSFRFFLAPFTDFIASFAFSYAIVLRIFLFVIFFLWSLAYFFINKTFILWLIMLFLSLAVACLDNCIDGYRIACFGDKLQISLLSENVLGYRIGIGFVSGFLVYITNFYSWEYVFLFFIFMSCFLLFLLFFVKTRKVMQVNLSILGFCDIVKNYQISILAIVIRSADIWMGGLLISYFVFYHGWSSYNIGLYLQFIGGFFAVFGVILASYTIAKIDIKFLLRIGVIFSFFLIILWIFSRKFNDSGLIILICCWNFWNGFYGLVFLRFITFLTSKSMPATHYSFLSSLSRCVGSLASLYGAHLISSGYWSEAMSIGLIGCLLSAICQAFFII